ncbi:MAG: hypothetical protein A2W93_01550 [Bacteroidetes bacterium GWF2_43_63]|nr:MAG: hypothetical protein A2W94_10520 [Bacteroidetes bacterium GWE2_42_42]OFY55753.1 MAG: hypothetical protein A2W93_01550 [Bacteroidetes bacterium GWF2_43_63]
MNFKIQYFYKKNMRLLFTSFICLLSLLSSAQNKYWVYLTDKDTTGYDPLEFFDSKAIERRVVNEIPVWDYSDIPVNQQYVAVLAQMTDSVRYSSRWFNAVCLYATDNQIDNIRTLSFVKKIEPAGNGHFVAAEDSPTTVIYGGAPGLQGKQLSLMGTEIFREAGITGKGIRVAIFDGGFPNVDVLPCFKHVRDNNRIIKTWDFTRNKENVYGFSSHGTTVMCCIAGIDTAGDPFGMATDAEFLLARTEVNAEPFSEEENWVAALEWADQNGADVVNSSLGYTFHRYFPYEMDGQTSFVTRGANMAASKGILVVNAAGNEGDGDWKYIGAPADADSILSVGGVDPYSGYHINFSSFGPTADGRLKPNVCAAGQVYAYGKKGTGVHYGTSFASPLTAGFAACAMQAKPGVKAYDMFLEIQKSGHLYPYYDYAHGYGIPQASYFMNIEVESLADIDILLADTSVIVSVVKDPTDSTENNYCYVHCSKPDGKLIWYKVISVSDYEVLRMNRSDFQPGDILRVHYSGLNESYKF